MEALQPNRTPPRRFTATTLEPAQPVPLNPCGHPAWACACQKHRQPIEPEDDPTIQHEPVTEEGY